jgi:cyclophilin family peptidyl-prolyl cis-trans isomerase
MIRTTAHPFPRTASALAAFAMLATLLTTTGCASTTNAPEHADELARLWIARDQRRVDDDVRRGLSSDVDNVRLYAVRALAACAASEPDAVPLLIQAAGDASPWVRAEALFGLGLAPRGPQIDLLRKAVDGDDELQRFLAIGSLGRVGGPEHLDAIAVHLTDRDPRLRGASALAASRIAGDALRAGVTIDGTQRARLRDALTRAARRETDEGASWRIAYALAHLGDVEAEATLIALTATSRPRFTRLFALRGLGMLPPTPAIGTALRAGVADADASLAYEAAAGLLTPARRADRDARTGDGLHHGDDATFDALVARLRDGAHDGANAHVTALLLRELPRAADRRETLEPMLRRFRADDVDVGLRAAALVGLAALLRDDAKDLVGGDARATDFRLRVAAAQASAALPAEHALALLTTLGADRDTRVAMAAIDATTKFRGDARAVAACRRALARRDYGILETVAPVACAHGDASLVDAIVAAFDAAVGPASAEARKLLLAAAHDLDADADAVRAVVERATTDPAHVVRAEARRRANVTAPDPIDRRSEWKPIEPGTVLPWAMLVSKPHLVVETDRGEIEIELLTAFAPVHCFNVLQLAVAGAYDGRVFHRVVPNFVVQGADRRGDGAGATAWHGGTMRDEISHLPFDVGMVGMPKSADPDTGGDQLFVTTVPTPHLDARYTVFGRVVRGMAVVESIAVGDVIRRIRVKMD